MRWIIFLVSSVLIAGSLAAQSPAINLRTSSSDPLDIMGDILYANELPEADMLARLNIAITVEQSAPASRDREFRTAQALLFRAIFHGQRQRQALSEADLTGAEKIVQAAFEPPSAWGCQLLSAIRSRLMVYRGVGYIIANSGAINDLALKALQLEPANVVARLIVAYGKINAPALFGGNPELGIGMLNQLNTRSDIQPTQRFAALLGMKRPRLSQLVKEYELGELGK